MPPCAHATVYFLTKIAFVVWHHHPGAVTNLQRIVAAVPTIKYVLDKGAKSVVLMSHLGRPQGNVVPAFSLAGPVHEAVQASVGCAVTMLPDCVGEEVAAACAEYVAKILDKKLLLRPTPFNG